MLAEALRLYEDGQSPGEEANIAKMLAADAAMAAGEACIQTFGGFGFASEYNIERKYREARPLSGSADIYKFDPQLYRRTCSGMDRSY